MKQEGEKAPLDVKVLNEQSEEVTLKDYVKEDGYLVVYFYPKDMTPGCTTQACSLRDMHEEIKDAGAEVIGVSKDPVSSHEKFKEKHNLSFELLSDEDHTLHEAFGVWVEKSMFGKKYMGAQRATFIIDSEGTIKKVWPKVKPDDHGEEVLEYLKKF